MVVARPVTLGNWQLKKYGMGREEGNARRKKGGKHPPIVAAALPRRGRATLPRSQEASRGVCVPRIVRGQGGRATGPQSRVRRAVVGVGGAAAGCRIDGGVREALAECEVLGGCDQARHTCVWDEWEWL